MAITNVNELWGKTWKLKDTPTIPSDFNLFNYTEGVIVGTITRGTDIKDIYQANATGNSVCFRASNGVISIGIRINSNTPIFTPNGYWSATGGGTPVKIKFVEKADDTYFFYGDNLENFIAWWNENATEYVPPFNDWAKGVSDAIREKSGKTNLIKPLNWAKEISNLETGGGDTLKALLDYTKSTKSLFSDNTTITDLTGLIPFNSTSNVTNTTGMFYGCSKLTTIPTFDTSKVTNMNKMFFNCFELTTIPTFDTSKVTNMNQMFYQCSKLTTIPTFDTSKVTNTGNMFYYCTILTTIPAFDMSSVTNMGSMFYQCPKIKTILMYGMKVSFSISHSTQFEREDLVTILNNLATVTSTQTLTMGTTNLAKLTDEDKAIATNKGWTLA